ncbi:RimK/LysX family protein, partial [Vibrio sp. OPT18]
LKDKTEFTLADRTHLSFPLLLGRSFFRDVAVVDVSQKYVQKKITK